MEDKIAVLRRYNGKRMRFEAGLKDGVSFVIEGTVCIRTVGGKERVYITDDNGNGVYINADETGINEQIAGALKK